MIFVALVLFFGFVSCDQQNPSPRGFYPVLVSPNSTVSRVDNKTEQYQQGAEYFVLTKEGLLQRIQLVFPQGVGAAPRPLPPQEPDATNFVLTPDGRLEKYEQPRPQQQQQQQQSNQQAEYFKLTTDGRLQRIESLPTEENGEYHVLLPNGKLQRVRFMTVAEANKLTSRVSYQEVDPISGPVYTYAEPLVRIV